MRIDSKPTEKELRELYQAAAEFKQAQPWTWLYDADVICVENPKDKTIGYCSVMGKGGEHYALGVYLGTEGIFGFYSMIQDAGSIPHHQLLHYQDCLMCSFEDRDQLVNDDRNQIKALGLSFRGKNAWPLFRRFEPGYSPWFLNEEECVFLTLALRQTLIAAEDVMSGRIKTDMEQGKTILRYSKEKDGKLAWYSKGTKLGYPVASYSPVEINDDILISRIKKAGKMGDVSLEADTLYMPSHVQDKKGERPYFPRILLFAEKKTGLVVDLEIYQSIVEDANVTIHKLTDICFEKGIPKEIHVRSDSMVSILGDFCKKTGIKLKTVKRLSHVDEVIEEMASHF